MTTIKLPGEWGLRKLSLADRSEWAIQYMGMDWMKISEFLRPPEDRSTLDEEIRKFARAMNGGIRSVRDKIKTLRAEAYLLERQADRLERHLEEGPL